MVTAADAAPDGAARGKRADARRNEQALLAAAAEVFVESGVDAPIRAIAARAGVGVGTIYRHFPNRADLVVAVFEHQVRDCAEAGRLLLADGGSPVAALDEWVDLFVDFLVTKHGLAEMLRADDARFGALHAHFLDQLVPVCAEILSAASRAGEVRDDVGAYELLRGIGNLTIGAHDDPAYDARRLIRVLLDGLRRG